jgi:predicted MFS family arabinose efflux permease
MIAQTISLYKNAYTGLSRSTWLLAVVMLINRCGTMVVPFLTMYMTQYIGVGIGKAGIVMSLFGAGSVIGALLGGKITDKVGFYYVQMVALAGGGLLFILLGLIKSYTGICITTFFLSMINEAFRPANSVAVAHYSSEENRTRSFALNRLAVNMGWAIGSAMGGLIASKSYQLLFWVDGITNILAAIMLYLLLAPSKNNATSKKQLSVYKGPTVYQDKEYLFFIGLQVLFAMCFFQLFTILPVYYKTQLHLSESFIGLVMAVNGLLIVAIEMVVVYRLDGRWPRLNIISFGVLLVGLAFVLLNVGIISAAFIALLSIVVVTIGEMLSMPFMNSYWISRTNNNNRGQYAGLYTTSWAVAQIAGPMAGSQIAEHFSYRLLWWLTGALCVVVSTAYYWMQKRGNKKLPTTAMGQ